MDGNLHRSLFSEESTQSHRVGVVSTTNFSFVPSDAWKDGSVDPQRPLDSSCDDDLGGAEHPCG